MSQERQIRTIQKISHELETAFRKVHQLCGSFLEGLDQHKENTKSHDNHTKSSSLEQAKSHNDHQDAGKGQSSKQHKASKSEESERSVDGKSEKKGLTEHKKVRHAEKPKQPGSAFLIFSNKNRATIKEEYPDMAHSDLMSVIGEVWKELTVAEKKPYEDEYTQEKAKYDSKMKEFLEKHPEERTKKQVKLDKKTHKNE